MPEIRLELKAVSRRHYDRQACSAGQNGKPDHGKKPCITHSGPIAAVGSRQRGESAYQGYG
jgi:hypothetical protein